jgi:hypothetical protein
LNTKNTKILVTLKVRIFVDILVFSARYVVYGRPHRDHAIAILLNVSNGGLNEKKRGGEKTGEIFLNVSHNL